MNFKMRTYRVARMTTGGCNERSADYVPFDEGVVNYSETVVNVNNHGTEQEEGIGKSPRKRLRSSDPTTQNPSGSEMALKITHVSGSTGKLLMSSDEQLTSLNAEIAQIRKQLDTLSEQLQTKNDERLEILKQKEAKCAAEKECLVKENTECKRLVMESLTSLKGADDGADKIKIDCKKTATNIESFFSNITRPNNN